VSVEAAVCGNAEEASIDKKSASQKLFLMKRRFLLMKGAQTPRPAASAISALGQAVKVHRKKSFFLSRFSVLSYAVDSSKFLFTASSRVIFFHLLFSGEIEQYE
jgi:hypothetical protein